MTATQHVLGKTSLVSLKPTANVTASGSGSAANVRQYTGTVEVVLDSEAANAGTNPTLDVSLEESEDGSTGWTDVPASAFYEGAFSQVTNAAKQEVRHMNVDDRKPHIREKHVIGGTSSPAFRYSLNFLGQKHAQ